MISVLLVAVGLYLTNNFNRDQLRLQRDSSSQQEALALEGQRADRFVAAVDQLGQEGSDKLSIRLGGIYSLEALMKDSQQDESTVVEVLSAFIRTHAPRPKTTFTHVPDSPTDVRAALTVLGRRPDAAHHTNLDLSNTLLGLTGANLADANLPGARLVDANLSGANLSGASLSRAHLDHADLDHARLLGADMTYTYDEGANLAGADVSRADLRGANLGEADLRNADLRGALLQGVHIVLSVH